MNNKVLELKKAGKHSYGTFFQMNSIVAIELIGLSGLDFVIIDSEHSQFGADIVYNSIVAADTRGLTPIVRIPDINRRSVLYALDAGAKGLIVPAIETVEQVKELVKISKYAPLGNRGYAPSRDGSWMTDESYENGGHVGFLKDANEKTLLIPQCETKSALENIDEIAALDGVDGIFLGPMDLSISLGHPLEMDHPEVIEGMKKVIAACQKNGKLSMVYCGDADVAHQMRDLGFDSFGVGADAFILLNAYKQLSDDLRK